MKHLRNILINDQLLVDGSSGTSFYYTIYCSASGVVVQRTPAKQCLLRGGCRMQISVTDI